MVFVLASSAVEAAPIAAASTPVGTWSYGVVDTFTVGPRTASNGWTYEGNATFGYTVTTYENNTSAGMLELTIFRTMGDSYALRFCHTSCANPNEWVNQTYRAWEATTSYTNFTITGTVFEDGTAVQAVSIENTTSFLRANVTETSDVFLRAIGEKGPHLAYLRASISGHSTVTFTPALGLFPDSLTPGTSWNSTSAFVAAGAADYAYYYAFHSPARNTIIGPNGGNVSLVGAGVVSVSGVYATGSTVDFGGVTYPAISLTVTGPFAVREGVVFVPSSVDLFGSSSQPWENNATGSSTAQLATLDLQPGQGAPFHLVASSWKVGSAAANAATTTSIDPSGSGLSPAAGAVNNPVSSATVQGVPQSSNQAAQTQQCLLGGGSCPPSNSTGPAPRGLVGLLVLGGAVAVIAVVVALAVTSRRRAPPPVYPNATLYPPGAHGQGAPTTPAGPPPAEEDPLDHLW